MGQCIHSLEACVGLRPEHDERNSRLFGLRTRNIFPPRSSAIAVGLLAKNVIEVLPNVPSLTASNGWACPS
jgi:hypothetical protein